MDGTPEEPRVARLIRIIRYNRDKTRDAALLVVSKRLIHAIVSTSGLCLVLLGVAGIDLGRGPLHAFGASSLLIVGLAIFWQGFAAFVNSFPEFAVFAARQSGFSAFMLERIVASTGAGSSAVACLAIGISNAATAFTAAFVQHRPALSFDVWEPLVLAVWFVGLAIVTRRRASVEVKPVVSA